MPETFLATAARRLRKRWLRAAWHHQKAVIRHAAYELKRSQLNAEFTRRSAELKIAEIESELVIVALGAEQ